MIIYGSCPQQSNNSVANPKRSESSPTYQVVPCRRLPRSGPNPWSAQVVRSVRSVSGPHWALHFCATAKRFSLWSVCTSVHPRKKSEVSGQNPTYRDPGRWMLRWKRLLACSENLSGFSRSL